VNSQRILLTCEKMPKSKRKRRSNNASGYFGVTLSGKRYQARIRVGKTMNNLGTYDTAKHKLPRSTMLLPSNAAERSQSLTFLNGQQSNNTSG